MRYIAFVVFYRLNNTSNHSEVMHVVRPVITAFNLICDRTDHWVS